MNYSPKLKNVIAQIKAILKENDIAGSVVLHSPGFSEYAIHLNTSYSSATFLGGELRVKTDHLPVPNEEKERLLRGTSNMLHHLSTVNGHMALNLIDISDKIDKRLDSKHFGTGHSSNIEQNN